MHANDTTPTPSTRPSKRRWGAFATLCTLVATTVGAIVSPVAPGAHAEDAAALPCTIYWDGGGGTAFWLDAANWSDDRLPTFADDACIHAVNAPATGITLDGASEQTVNSLRSEVNLRVATDPAVGLRFVGPSTLGDLYVDAGYVESDSTLATGSVFQAGGAVGGAGGITVYGDYHWSAGQMWGSGWTSVQSSSAGQFGLYVEGGNELQIDQRLVETLYGFRWYDDTVLHFLNGGSLRTYGQSQIDAPGASIDGVGTLDNRGGISVMQEADVVVNAPYAGVDASWWNVATLADLTLGGTSVVDGDLHLLTGSTATIDGDVRFTSASEIVGPGTVAIVTPAAKFVDEGTIDIQGIDNQGGSMTIRNTAKVSDVENSGGDIVVANPVTLEAASFAQEGGSVTGNVHVTGDADVSDGIISGAAGSGDRFSVDGILTIDGEVIADSIDITTADLTFFGFSADGDPQLLSLVGDAVAVDVTGTATSAVDATITTKPATTNGTFHATTLDVTAGTLDLDVPTDVGVDDTVTVAAEAELVMTNVHQRGTVTISGALDLTGGATIEADLDAIDQADIRIGDDAIVTLVDGAVVGGSTATVEMAGWLQGQGGLSGDITNSGLIETDAGIDVLGHYAQTETGDLTVHVNGDHYGSIDVVGDAEIAGDLDVVLADGAALPTAEFFVVSATGALTGTFTASNGLGGCAELDYRTHAVAVVPQPCLAVAAGHAQEDAGQVDFVVSLSEPSSTPVVVHHSIVPGTADITDYVDEPGASITIPAGAITGTISVDLVDDDEEEQDETFTLSLSADGGVLQNAEATGTIIDDDTKLDLSYQSIPMLDGIQYIEGLGTEYVVGVSSPDADTDIGWAYRISDDTFAQTKDNFQPSAINQHDQAVGSCGANACMRDHGVDTILDEPAGSSAIPTAINDDGVIVGYLLQIDAEVAVRWADASAPVEVLAGLPGSTRNEALDVNSAGAIVGTSRLGDEVHGWVRTADGTVTDIGTIVGLPRITIAGIAADGTVAGGANSKELYSENYHGFTWTKAGGIVDLGPKTFVQDINSQGDMVGLTDSRATLWRGDRSIDLNKALGLGPDSESGLTLVDAEKINDQGTIVVTGSFSGGQTTGVLVPPGAGCKVCLDAHVYEAEFPRPDYLVDAGDQIVEGTPAELFAEVTNHDETTRTVTVNFIGTEGQPLGEPQTLTLGPKTKQITSANWDTEGLAWKDGVDAGPVDLKVEMRDAGGRVLASFPFRLRVVPRPVVNVHGMNSDASTWAGYPAFLSNAHVGWKAFAIDTMNTKPWIPNTIAQNAALLDQYITKIQTEQNAWQVDLVAHSMGGLISRYYIQNLMQDHDGHRSARQLVMLGTPNAGSPCADLFRVPMTAELRTDTMREFNAAITDHRGVPFSIAAGDPLLATCNIIGLGDMVVPLDSALTGVDDSEVFPILHTDMTFSGQLFTNFVLPRLDGQHQVAAAAPSANHVAASTLAAIGAEAVPAEATSAAAQPQLLQRDTASVDAGATVNIPVQVPTGLSAFGVTALGNASLEIALVKSGTVVATTGTDPASGSDFRTISTMSPASGSWTIRLINHGTSTLESEVATWSQGSATLLEAHAEQVGILGAVKVTARLTGATLEHPVTAMTMTATDRSTEGPRSGGIYDDGKNGDAVAGDGIFTGSVSGLKPGPVVIDVSTDSGYFYRVVSTAVVLTVGTDGPGNDAPVALPANVTVPTGSTSRINLEAADPEGEPLTYHIVSMPTHGQLGGSGPFFDYLPAKGYQGTDSFTYRVNDGTQYSPTATVTITVGRADTTILFREPSPATVTTNSTMHVVLRVEGPSNESVNDGPVTLTFGSHTVNATVISGRVDADVLADLPGGRHDLVVQFGGNSGYAPATITQSILVVEGVAPVPSLQPVTGEAGYTVRFQGLAGDSDGDAIRFQFDFTDDGVFDAESGPSTKLVLADHVFDAAFDGKARLRVTDAAGHVVEVVADVHIAAHRDLGALHRILVDGQPVRELDISSDGRYVLYEATDHEDGQQLPTPYGVLDLQTGTHVLASVRPDGRVDGMPRGGVLSPDGRTVAFASDEVVGALIAPQIYVRNLDTGATVLVSLNASGQRSDRGSYPLAVTNGGTEVLFQSFSTNMTAFDNLVCGTLGQTREPCEQLYVRDVTAATTTLVSERIGTEVAEVEPWASMSSDGRYIAYASRQALWFVDTQTSARTKLPIGIGGADGNRYGTAEEINVSDDGRYVTFTSEATNLVPNDTDAAPDVYRFDRQTGTTAVLSITTTGSASIGSQGTTADRCAARTVFWSFSPDIVAGDSNHVGDVFVREASGTIRRISVEARDGIEANRASISDPHLSGNGRFVVFQSEATNLVPGDVEAYRDTFVLDLGNTTSCGTTPPPPVNHAPTASSSAASTDEDTSVPVTLAGTDSDGDALSYTIVNGPTHGTLSGTGETRTYTPAANWSGTDSLTFTVSDGTVTSPTAALVTITVRPVNDAPTVTVTAPESLTEGSTGSLTATGTDADGDALVYTWTTDGGSVLPDGAGTAATLAAGDGPATRHITVTVSDGTAIASAAKDVLVTNVAPGVTITAPATDPTVSTGEVLAVTATVDDVGGDAVTCSIAWGDTSPATAGCSGSHSWSTAGAYIVKVTAADDDGATSTATRTVTVTSGVWTFTGFFPPVANAPVVNVIERGSTVPVKFSLGGYKGTAIFAAGYPASYSHPCSGTGQNGPLEAAKSTSGGLQYDPASTQYNFTWQTANAWAGTCRTLVVKLADGSVRTAEFQIKR